MAYLPTIITAYLIAFSCVYADSDDSASSSEEADCSGLPTHNELKDALKTAVNDDFEFGNCGIEVNEQNLEMWAATVNRDGCICSVAFSGDTRGDQWPGSRAIAAQKAFTANAFSLDILSLSTAALYPLTQPGASLFGLQFSNPVNPTVAYGPKTKTSEYGTSKDPLIGNIMGGVNVFGGGLGLYDASSDPLSAGPIIGGLGVSGDSSCADAIIAWKLRHILGLDYAPNCDQISVTENGHPDCGNVQTCIDDASSTFSLSSGVDCP